MRIFIGIVLLLCATLLQVTLATRVALLHGSADLVLLTMLAWMLLPGNRPDWRWGIPAGLMVGYASALPDWVLLVAYVAAAGMCQILNERIWQLNLLTLLTGTLLGTLCIHAVTLAYLLLSSQTIDPLQAINLITVPTMLLNLIFILPIHAIMGEFARMVTPIEEPA